MRWRTCSSCDDEPMADPHDLIDVDRLVARTVELVQIPSVNPFDEPMGEGEGEDAAAAWLQGHLERLGHDIATEEISDGRPNVIGVGPGGDGDVVCLAGHLDTVGVVGYDNPFSGEVRNGRVYGRGTCDMKGALAAFVEVADVLAASGTSLDGRLMIAGIADEEHGMVGSALAGATGPIADHLIVGEPTSLAVCPAHKGQYAFPIHTQGRAVHSSIKHEGVNAIEHMMEIMRMLGDYEAELRSNEPHDLLGLASVNLGVIRGGDMVSIVPDACELHVDRRLVPGETSAEVRAELERRIAAISDDRGGFGWGIGDPMVDARPLDTERDAPVVVAAQQAMRGRGLSDRLEACTGSTDAPNLGGPAIIWGPGSLSQAHTIDEWLDIGELEAAAHLYLDAVLALAGGVR